MSSKSKVKSSSFSSNNASKSSSNGSFQTISIMVVVGSIFIYTIWLSMYIQNQLSKIDSSDEIENNKNGNGQIKYLQIEMTNLKRKMEALEEKLSGVKLEILKFSDSVRSIKQKSSGQGQNTQTSNYDYYKISLDEFKKEIDELSKKFPSQSPQGWSDIMTAVNPTLGPNPNRPGVIVLLKPKGIRSDFTHCLALKIAKAIHNGFGSGYQNMIPRTIDVGPNDNPDEDFGKTRVSKIRRDFNDYFSQEGKALIVKGIDRLKSGEHLTLIKNYTDKLKAPNTRASIIFIIDMKNDSDSDDGGLSLLEKAWKDSDLETDKKYEVMSNILQYVIVVNKGDTCA